MAGTPEQFFDDLLRRDPSRPFVTYYDEASGERAELSAKSMANWVAKTHHFLGDQLGLGAGDTAVLALPRHWLSVPVLLGCLTAGLALADTPPGDVAFVGRGGAAVDVPDVFDPDEYAAAVRPQPDVWAGVQFGGTPTDPCLPGLTRSEAADFARSRADELGLADRARVLTVRPWAGPADWVDTLLAPLAVGGSVVYVDNCTDAAVLDRRAEQERVTSRV